jgi:hypothetical protein
MWALRWAGWEGLGREGRWEGLGRELCRGIGNCGDGGMGKERRVYPALAIWRFGVLYSQMEEDSVATHISDTHFGVFRRIQSQLSYIIYVFDSLA